jgi:hypothetical protein
MRTVCSGESVCKLVRKVDDRLEINPAIEYCSRFTQKIDHKHCCLIRRNVTIEKGDKK